MEYKPYQWIGEDQDAHVKDFRALEDLEMLRNATGGGTARLWEMAALDAYITRPIDSLTSTERMVWPSEPM